MIWNALTIQGNSAEQPDGAAWPRPELGALIDLIARRVPSNLESARHPSEAARRVNIWRESHEQRGWCGMGRRAPNSQEGSEWPGRCRAARGRRMAGNTSISEEGA